MAETVDPVHDEYILELPGQKTIDVSPKRRPELEPRSWPAGTRIVSADSHLIEQDYWYEGFPEHKKGQAPRMLFKDGYFDLTIGERHMTAPKLAEHLYVSMEGTPGLNDIPARLADLDAEGVEKELIFPQRLFGLFMFGEMQNREEVFGLYNQAIARRCAEAPGRLYSVMVPNYWDMPAAADSVSECRQLGARGLMVPLKPGKDKDGNHINYNDPNMDPLFDAIASSGIPLIFHIGEAVRTSAHGAAGIGLLVQMQGFRLQWSQLTFGGVFDRFPSLKAVFVEGGLSWVASMLHDADMAATHFRTSINPKLKHAPSWYWRNHCYATFMTDPVGLSLLDRIGPETCLWSSDYPHQESTFGYSRSSIQAVFDATTVENAQLIVGKTALRLFDMV
ncbi:MAG: amidohydrolase family protein [Proteobacteria bacterium]|nr:amidohydrolase family protein [Pseudomonadota bacterium]